MLKKFFISLFISYFLFTNIESSWAHASLVSSYPRANSVIYTVPKKITLTFSEELLRIKNKPINKITVLGRGTLEFKSTTQVSGRKIFLKVPSLDSKGEYQVNWRAVSKDGHVLTGNFKFKLN